MKGPMEKNRFVREEQAKMRAMMGDKPKLPAEMKKFNAYMSNDGEAAEAACHKLAADIDKKAFPIS